MHEDNNLLLQAVNDELIAVKNYANKRITELEAENKRLREALEKYANEDHWESHNGFWANVFDNGSPCDGWVIAKWALVPEEVKARPR